MAGASPSGPVTLDAALTRSGYLVVHDVVSPDIVAALVDATDRAVAEEVAEFPPGDDQHGRLLFAPAHGGAFVDLCAFDPLFAPMEDHLGGDAIIYTMTTSVLAPHCGGPAGTYHLDVEPDRPPGLAVTALVMLDPFEASTGAMEVLAGSHREAGDGAPDRPGELVTGAPGDVCYFDPQVWHRSTTNRSETTRRAVLVQMARPWMKQRVDVRGLFTPEQVADMAPGTRRRLGLDALPPRDRHEFLARRDQRPWT